jgi:hypothetical protein
MATLIHDGDKLTCDQGDAPAKLVVTTTGGALDGRAAATVADKEGVTNVPPMGTCKKLTAQAGGVPTPCAPNPQGWQGPACGGALGGRALLTDGHTCPCAEGGVIRVAPAGVVRLTAV